MPEGFTPILIAVLVLAVIFDYINGFHDTANAIATSVSTRALKPHWAIAMSATANFVGALSGTEVARTVGSGLVDPRSRARWWWPPPSSAPSPGTWGWRIIRTMGTKVVKLYPVHGFATETTAATIIFGASNLGMPVSTTHVISSAIMGTGSSDRFNSVRWGVARNIGIAWVLTLPAAGGTAALSYLVLSPILG